jgi:hypothetical protein
MDFILLEANGSEYLSFTYEFLFAVLKRILVSVSCSHADYTFKRISFGVSTRFNRAKTWPSAVLSVDTAISLGIPEKARHILES